MTEPEEARKYLETALAEAGVEMKVASEALGKNHAYLQQYIRSGKPLWLSDQVREALAAAYGIDVEPLKPPPIRLRATNKQMRAHRGDQRQIDPPRRRKLVDDPGALQLLDIWDQIRDPAMRELALSILRNMVHAGAAAVVA
jgi:hypothetical protein